MSLNWDVSKVPNYHTNFPDVETPEGRQWNPVTFALVSAMMIVGPLIEKDIEEFWLRLSLYQEKVGPLLTKCGEDGKGEGVLITRQQVEQHIGIKVNVAPVTKASFNATFMRILRSDHERVARWEKRKAEEAATAKA